jgi:hypothetical protein
LYLKTLLQTCYTLVLQGNEALGKRTKGGYLGDNAHSQAIAESA